MGKTHKITAAQSLIQIQISLLQHCTHSAQDYN